jgi:hypothetical protein
MSSHMSPKLRKKSCFSIVYKLPAGPTISILRHVKGQG